MSILKLVHLNLVLLLRFLKRLCFLIQLLIQSLQLLGQERNLTVFLRDGLV